MTPEAIIAMVTAVANATTEVCKVLQTPGGQAQLQQISKDRASWDAFWKPVGDGIKAFFTGELFKQK